MSEKRSENSEMHDVAECAELIRQIVPREHRSMKQWVAATAHRLGWSYARTKGVWYSEARAINGWEKDALRAAKRANETKKTTRKLANDYTSAVRRIEVLQEALAAVGARMDRGQVAALERELRSRGDLDRP